MKKIKKYYLAYGSNLNKAQMMYRCPNATVVGHAFIDDYKLLYKGSKSGAYLTIEKQPGSYVPVGVWSVTADDELNLDRYEGFPRFYYKKTINIKVYRNDGTMEEVEAFVYIMHEDRPLGVPSQEYIDICEEGYFDFSFNPNIIDAALSASVEME